MTSTTVKVPTKIDVATAYVVKEANSDPKIKSLPRVSKHLFSLDGTDDFPIKHGSSWEQGLLEKELSDGEETLQGWYRNPSSGKHALSIQYHQAGDEGLLHPDFIFFHQDESRIVVDIVDPHQHDKADTGPKWRGLASYVEGVARSGDGDWLRHVRAVIKAMSPTGEEVLRAVDLRDENVRVALEGANHKADIEAVFAAHGFDY